MSVAIYTMMCDMHVLSDLLPDELEISGVKYRRVRNGDGTPKVENGQMVYAMEGGNFHNSF